MTDDINHPKHYTSHPSGIECIQITRHMGFVLGNALKYIWRADLKGSGIEDLKKAAWYINDEIKRREEAAMTPDEKKFSFIDKALTIKDAEIKADRMLRNKSVDSLMRDVFPDG